MLDRKEIAEFIDREFKQRKIKIPKNIKREDLVETFCQFAEEDYDEWRKEGVEKAFELYLEDNYDQWLKDNFNSFFEREEINWECIGERIKSSKKKQTKS